MDEKNELEQDVVPYKATGNLNTAIENPQININSAVDVNIQNFPSNIDSGTIQNLDNNNYDTNVINNSMNNNPTTVNPIMNNEPSNYTPSVENNMNVGVTNTVSTPVDNNNYDEVQYVSTNGMGNTYEPTIDGKKKNRFSITIPKELKVIAFIVFLLFIFVMAIPGIYDFFKDLGLVVTG